MATVERGGPPRKRVKWYISAEESAHLNYWVTHCRKRERERVH